ncbi:hypothetical protein CSPAE12_05522 [Colletotrichum incanum]|nr:hypothetical protein CSPAE12_05522 [Colletotrichum incanum]
MSLCARVRGLLGGERRGSRMRLLMRQWIRSTRREGRRGRSVGREESSQSGWFGCGKGQKRRAGANWAVGALGRAVEWGYCCWGWTS